MFTGFARWIGFLTIAAVVSGVVALGCGFGWFVSQISDQEPKLTEDADGIVVLTGAAARIPDAIELLVGHRGKRLLITGVHRTTSAKEISRLIPLNEKTFNCCVDLDRSALNTLGNAIETRRWARDRGFHSLIVVTSNWHMPRAMAELEHQLPDTRLIAYPVVAERVTGEPWWTSSAKARLLIGEYLKYLFAVLRMRLDPDLG